MEKCIITEDIELGSRKFIMKVFQDDYSAKVAFFESEKIVLNIGIPLNQAIEDFTKQNSSISETLELVATICKNDFKQFIENKLL